MKFGPVTKLDKRSKRTSKKFDDDVMSENCDISVILSLFEHSHTHTHTYTHTHTHTHKHLKTNS